jgi:hypothetical protein
VFLIQNPSNIHFESSIRVQYIFLWHYRTETYH